MKNTGRLALCGILAGLGVAIMLCSAVLPSFTYALPMIAGGLLLIPSIEFGSRTALYTYAATGLLSLILPCDKEAAFLYLALFGLYPIAKKYFERIPRRWLEIVLKYLYFNIAAVGAVGLASAVLGLPIDTEPFGRWYIPVMLVLGNICFFIYDLALTGFIPMYIQRLQPVLRKTLHLK